MQNTLKQGTLEIIKKHGKRLLKHYLYRLHLARTASTNILDHQQMNPAASLSMAVREHRAEHLTSGEASEEND
jgi:hypothetical protein